MYYIFCEFCHFTRVKSSKEILYINKPNFFFHVFDSLAEQKKNISDAWCNLDRVAEMRKHLFCHTDALKFLSPASLYYNLININVVTSKTSNIMNAWSNDAGILFDNMNYKNKINNPSNWSFLIQVRTGMIQP